MGGRVGEDGEGDGGRGGRGIRVAASGSKRLEAMIYLLGLCEYDLACGT